MHNYLEQADHQILLLRFLNTSLCIHIWPEELTPLFLFSDEVGRVAVNHISHHVDMYMKLTYNRREEHWQWGYTEVRKNVLALFTYLTTFSVLQDNPDYHHSNSSIISS